MQHFRESINSCVFNMAAGSILQVHLLFTFSSLHFDDIRLGGGLNPEFHNPK